MSFESKTFKPATAEFDGSNSNLLPPEIAGPSKADESQARGFFQHPLSIAAAATAAGGLAHEIIPRNFDLLSNHEFAKGGRWSNKTGTLGTEIFGKESAIASKFPQANFGQAEQAVNEVSRAGLKPLAKAWQANRLVPEAAAAAAEAAPTVTATAAAAEAAPTVTATAAAETKGVFTGLKGAATQLTENAGKFFIDKPNLASAGRAGLLIGGAALADNYLDKDGYHLAVPGMAIGMIAKEGLLAPAAIGLGAFAVSKVLGPASPEMERIMRPGVSDTLLLAGAASLPLAGTAKAYTLGGAYVMGRMAHMDSSEAALASGAVGLTALAKTHNPYVAVAAGTGSYLSSRVLGWMG